MVGVAILVDQSVVDSDPTLHVLIPRTSILSKRSNGSTVQVGVGISTALRLWSCLGHQGRATVQSKIAEEHMNQSLKFLKSWLASHDNIISQVDGVGDLSAE